MFSSYPTDDDPFHVICSFSTSHHYYYLYEVNLGNLTMLKQLEEPSVHLTEEWNLNRSLPNEILSKVIYELVMGYIKDRDPGGAMEYLFLNTECLKRFYYDCFGFQTMKDIDSQDQVELMIKRVGNMMRLLYYIIDQMDCLEDPNLTSFLTFQLNGCIDIYDILHLYEDGGVVYPYMLSLAPMEYILPEINCPWICMVPYEENHVGASYTPWCNGYENHGIWKVYKLAWPLIQINFDFSGTTRKKKWKVDQDSWAKFESILVMIFGRYTMIEEVITRRRETF